MSGPLAVTISKRHVDGTCDVRLHGPGGWFTIEAYMSPSAAKVRARQVARTVGVEHTDDEDTVR